MPSRTGRTQRPTGDRPARSLEDDALGRRAFVTSIVTTVRRAPADGYVCALTGAWGEGKSSVLAFVAEQLGEHPDVQVIAFEPWLFSGSDQLLERFFAQFAAEVAGPGKARQAAQALVQFGALLGRLRELPVIGSTAQAIEAGTALLGVSSSLERSRAEATAALAELDHQVVVLIDDVDRLADQEIVEVLRLVRLVGDLPNVTYLLSYEHGRVARAVGRGDEQLGTRYLEKIVQTVFELPPIRQSRLQEPLSIAIDQAREIFNDEELFDAEHWRLLQYAGFLGLFRTLRDVRRFASGLPALLGQCAGELEVGDLLALEAIRVLRPATFRLIVDRAAQLTLLSPSAVLRAGRQPEEDEHLPEAFKKLELREGPVLAVAEVLFPRLRSDGLMGMGVGAAPPQWRRLGRLADADNLRIYLQRGLDDDDLSRAAMERMVDALSEPKEVEDLLASMAVGRWVEDVDRLLDCAQGLRLRQAAMTVQHLVQALVDSRELDADAPSHLTPNAAVGRLLELVLAELGVAASDVVGTVRWPDLSVRAETVTMLARRPSTQALSRAAEQAEVELARAVLEASSSELAGETELAVVLHRAGRVDPDGTRARMSALIEDRAFLLAWLTARLGTVRRADGDEERYLLWKRRLRDVDAPDRLKSLVLSLDDDRLARNASEDERLAVELARRSIDNPAEADRLEREFGSHD